MAEILKKIDLNATFAKMKVGDAVEIKVTDAGEGNVRATASKYNKKHNTKLVVTVQPEVAATTVTRIS